MEAVVHLSCGQLKMSTRKSLKSFWGGGAPNTGDKYCRNPSLAAGYWHVDIVKVLLGGVVCHSRQCL